MLNALTSSLAPWTSGARLGRPFGPVVELRYFPEHAFELHPVVCAHPQAMKSGVADWASSNRLAEPAGAASSPRPSKLWIKIWVRLAGRWQEQYQILILLISFCWTTSLTNVRFPCKCQNDSSNENTRQQCGLPQGRSRFHCQKEHASTLGLTGKHTAKKQKSEYGLGLAKNWYRSKRQGAARPQWAKHIVLHMSNSPRAAHSWPRS